MAKKGGEDPKNKSWKKLGEDLKKLGDGAFNALVDNAKSEQELITRVNKMINDKFNGVIPKEVETVIKKYPMQIKNGKITSNYVLDDQGSPKTNYFGGGVIEDYRPDFNFTKKDEAEVDPDVVEEIPQPKKQKGRSRGSGSGAGVRSTSTRDQGINQQYDANNAPRNEYMRLANETKTNELLQQYGNISNMSADQIDEHYAPDDQLPDFAGPVGDAGRAIMGYVGTQEEIPGYKPSAEMVESIGDARRQKEIGLSAEEEGLRGQMADRAYAADVANIRRMSGGSAATALSNLGSASTRYGNRMSQTAAIDESTRRMAEARFDERAGQAENIKRIQHGEKRGEAMMNVQAASGLMGDALTNMRERADFNKYYGKGSAHYELSKERTLDSRRYRKDRENAAETLRASELGKLRDDIIGQDIAVKGAKIYGSNAENDAHVKKTQAAAMNDIKSNEINDAEFASKMADGYKGGEDVTVRNKFTVEDGDPIMGGKVKYSEKKVEQKLADVPEEDRASFLESNNPFNKEAKKYSESDGYDQFNKEHSKKLKSLYDKAEKWENDMLSKIK